MNNIALMLSEFNTQEKIDENILDYGYLVLGLFRENNPLSYSIYGCRFCGNLVPVHKWSTEIKDATTNMLVVHAVHCTGVSLGVRVVRAKKYREDRENAV